MIPVQLRIKNFLSYGPAVQTIDFGPYPLICLSGKNGHGKSALLDAMTWALWGQARKTTGTAKPDQGLLHLGQTQMMVAFDFICNGTHYRIKREYAQTYGKPYANLEFGVLENGERWVPLTNKTIRSTQEVIEKTLRLSYEAFTNSAFLRQGQSHEFSTKSPKERKEVLAAILGLHEYELVRKQALEKIKELTTQKQTSQVYKEKLIQELEKKSEIELHYATLQQELQKLHQAEHEILIKQKELEANFKAIQEQQKEQHLLTFKREQLLHQQEQLRQQLRAKHEEWKEVQRFHRQLKNPQELEAKKRQLQQELSTQQILQQQRLQLKEELLQAKSSLQSIEQSFIMEYTHTLQEQRLHVDRLFMKVEHASQQLKELNEKRFAKEAEVSRYSNDLTVLKQKINESTIDVKECTRLEEQFEKRKSFYQQYRSQGLWVTNELELLQQKQQLSKDENNPSCPLCEQNLSVSRKKFLQQKFNTHERFLKHRLQRLTKIVASLKELLIEQHTQLATYKKKQEEHQQIIFTIAEYEKKITELSQDIKNLDTQIEQSQKTLIELQCQHQSETKLLEVKQQQLKSSLAQHPAYQDMSNVIQNLTQKLVDLNYDEKTHSNVQQQLNMIEQEQQKQTSILHEYAQQESRKLEINTLCSQLKKLKQELLIVSHQITLYAALEEKLKVYEFKKRELELQTKNIQSIKEQLFQQKGSLELEIKRCEQLEKESVFYQKQLTDYTHLIDDYQAIAAATSKDGVQALLIEQALPEIEYEANTLLSKLTNNQAHIIIESLRDLKKGGSKETLDIKISDAAGIRPYELFSGGEAFRIDFALRIAISKLLAKRAGTSLQTLIIDEGFGSQDDEGLSHIMDAIYKIQDDFSKVIIVSHLPTMKDNFPVHFYVEKKAHGSTVQIIEQG